MDTHAPWRALEADDPRSAGDEPSPPASGVPRLVLAAGGVVLVAVSVAIVLGTQLFAAPSGVAPVRATGSPAAVSEASGTLVVQVGGAVAHPGVYTLPAGSRVADAVRAAGGYSPDVDVRQAEAKVNLAARVQDGAIVTIPRRGATVTTGSSPVGSGTALLNLNTATVQELDTLPGVGPATATKIVEAREKQPFRSVDELVTRKILSAATLGKLRDRVCV